MSLRLALVILKKELREITRDLRALLILVAVPALLYPLLMIGAGSLAQKGAASLEQRELLVRIVPPLPVEVEEALRGMDRVKLVLPGEPLEDKEPDAVVRTRPPDLPGPGAVVLVEVDRARELSLVAESRLTAVLERARILARDQRLRELVPADVLEVGAVEVVDTAAPDQRGGFLLGRMMAPILLMMLVIGAFYPAIDLSAGERERQTLRSLLCAPVHPTTIALGKLLAVSLVAILAALANLTGLTLTVAAGLGPEAGVTALPVDPTSLAISALVLIPLAIYASAALLAVAAFAKNAREAQTLLTPVLLLLVLPAAAAAFPGMEATWPRALIPVFGPALVVREAFAGTWTWPLVVAGAVGAVTLVVVTVGIAARAFTVEALLTGRVRRPARLPGPLEPFDAVLLLFAVAAGFVYAAGPMSRLPVAAGIALPQLALFLGLPVVVVLARSTTPLAALGLRRPRTGAPLLVWAGALLMAPSAGALAARVSHALFPVDAGLLEGFDRIAKGLEGLPLPALVALFVLLPAVCEELCFRGAILGAFSRRPVIGLLISTVAFSALHGALIRALPTLVVGLLAGVVALRARSVLPAMSVHLLHNGLALALGLALEGDAAALLDEGRGIYDALPVAAHVLAVFGLGMFAYGLWRDRGRA